MKLQFSTGIAFVKEEESYFFYHCDRVIFLPLEIAICITVTVSLRHLSAT